MRRIELKIFGAVLMLFLLACGTSSNQDDHEIVDDFDGTFTLPATDTTRAMDYSLSVSGSGSSRVGDISISNSAGTIEFDGETLDTIVYEYIPWESTGYNLYQGIAISDTDLFVYWVYCRTSNDSVALIYYESINQYDIAHEGGSGTCAMQETEVQPALALTERSLDISRLVSGFTITGDEISYDGNVAGTYTYGETTYALYPFELVDCSDCSGGDWQELHSILYNAEEAKACFTILYLMEGSEDMVISSYSICFPDLDNVNAVLTATWTVP